MVIYKTRWFDRWARKEGLTTPALCDAVREMVSGLFELTLVAGCSRNGLRVPAKERAADIGRPSPPTRAIAGSSCMASRRTNVATSIGTKRKH